MKNVRRFISTIVGLLAVVSLPGTAHAETEPIRPGSGSVPLPHADLHRAAAADLFPSGWGLALAVVAVMAVAIAVGLFVVGGRLVRR